MSFPHVHCEVTAHARRWRCSVTARNFPPCGSKLERMVLVYQLMSRRELCEMLHLNRKAEIEIIQCGQENGSGQKEETQSRHRLVQYIVDRLL